jgi:hypothetical protein
MTQEARPMIRTLAAHPRRKTTVLLLSLALAGVVAVSVAWATDAFSDVPSSSVHHDDVTAIRNGGITTGCNPPANTLYCPEQAVRRDQMASFLRRGLSRSAFGSWFGMPVPAGTDVEVTVVGVPITVGLPAGAHPDAANFVQATAEVRIELLDATGCPCSFRAALVDADSGLYIDGLFYARTVLDAARPVDTIPVVGRARYTTSGEQTIAVVVGRDTVSPSAVAEASANVSLTSMPFGADGSSEGAGAQTVGVVRKRG